jgi:hypothetical protein
MVSASVCFSCSARGVHGVLLLLGKKLSLIAGILV